MRAKLATKLLAIMGEVERVGKDGFNQGQRFAFASESAFIEAVRPAFIKHKVTPPAPVAVVYHGSTVAVAKSGSESQTLLASVNYEVVDAETGMAKTLAILAAGNDQLDKHAYKAMTGALKYAIKQLLLLPTGDDPDASGPAPRQATTQQRAASASQTASKPAGMNQLDFVAHLKERGLTVEQAKAVVGMEADQPFGKKFPTLDDALLAIVAAQQLGRASIAQA